jgi:hypothetical protein
MPGAKSDLINLADLGDVQRWMREFNISKEELIAAVHKFGASKEDVSAGLQKSIQKRRSLN